MPPDLSFENALSGVICGIDEVGRDLWPGGGRCGDLPPQLPIALLTTLDDSKALSANRREVLFAIIEDVALVGVGEASVAEIDQVNILQATFLAMARALERLQEASGRAVDWALVAIRKLGRAARTVPRIAEFTAEIFDRETLPVVEICPKSNFFSFSAKYQKGATQYICPAQIPENLTRKVSTACLWLPRDALGCEGFARVDLRVDEDEQPFILEVNTIPAFTETSLFPKAAQEGGYKFRAGV